MLWGPQPGPARGRQEAHAQATARQAAASLRPRPVPVSILEPSPGLPVGPRPAPGLADQVVSFMSTFPALGPTCNFVMFSITQGTILKTYGSLKSSSPDPNLVSSDRHFPCGQSPSRSAGSHGNTHGIPGAPTTGRVRGRAWALRPCCGSERKIACPGNVF